MYEDDFEDRFADELENLAEFESQQTLPVQPVVKKNFAANASTAPLKSQPARNVAEDFFGGSQSTLEYPDEDDEELEEVTPANRKRPTSDSSIKNTEKRRRIDDNNLDDDDVENNLIIDDDDYTECRHRVFDAINGDIPNGSKNGFRGNGVRTSLSSVLKNKGEPLRDKRISNGEDNFTADSFKITKEISALGKSKRSSGALKNHANNDACDNVNGDDVRKRVNSIYDDLERRRVFKHPPSTDDYVYVTQGSKGMEFNACLNKMT